MKLQFACVVVTLVFASIAHASQDASCNFTVLSNVDLNGGDLPGQPVSKTVSSPEECATLCCANPNCRAWSRTGVLMPLFFAPNVLLLMCCL